MLKCTCSSEAGLHVPHRRALEGMPDMATVEEYQSIPVEAFGEAMLRGMGWTEGKALGRTDMQASPDQAPATTTVVLRLRLAYLYACH